MRALEILKAIEEVFPMRSPRRGEGDGFLEVPAPGATQAHGRRRKRCGSTAYYRLIHRQ